LTEILLRLMTVGVACAQEDLAYCMSSKMRSSQTITRDFSNHLPVRACPIRGVVGIVLLLSACGETAVSVPPVVSVHPDAAHSDARARLDSTPQDAGHPDAEDFVPDMGIQDVDAGPSACELPLTYEGDQAAVLSLDTIVLAIAGGSGAYRFTYVENQSGGILNPISGQYVSGTISGTVDKFQVTDETCADILNFQMRVVLPMQVRPSSFSIPRGGIFTFEVDEGSGRFDFQKLTGSTSSTLTPSGTYTASNELVRDRIEITDLETKELTEVQIQVVDGVALEVETERVFLPLGHEHVLKVQGGSGWFDIISSSTVAVISDHTRIYGDTPGETILTVRDHFINGVTATADVHVIAPHASTSTRAGDYLRESKSLSPGDINGDGYDDIVVGIADVNVGSYNSGGIFVYPGGPNGVSPQPAQVLTAYAPEARMGYGLEVADFDRDGQLDLLAAVPLAGDDLAPRRGFVHLYRGVSNGFFETEPSQIWKGDYSYDYFGQSVTVCDFNQDGLLDFAASANQGEDRQPRPVYYTQGHTKIFLQRPGGFLETSDIDLYGQLFTPGTGFTGYADLRMGLKIDSGDFDGDGACDLVTSTYLYRSPNGGNRNGLIYVYRGRPSTSMDFGGVSAFPEIGFRSGLPGQTNSYMGRYLDVADINQDGKDDIISSDQDYTEVLTRRGAVRIFAGRTLADAPLTDLIWSDQADYVALGDSAEDRMGYYVGSGDHDGDGIIDLIAAAYQSESRGGPVNAGIIHVYRGQSGTWPSVVPTATIATGKSYDRFGISFSFAGDLNRDGENDMIVYSSESDFHGVNAGGVEVVSGTTTPTAMMLQLPGWQASGDRLGYGVAMLGDVNGDGLGDMVASAPYLDTRAIGTAIGAGFIYLGGTTGINHEPAMTLLGFRRHSGSDYYGWRVSSAGDFDRRRDPLFSQDIAMLGRFEDYPSSFNTNNYVLDGNCTNVSRNNVGAVAIWSGSSSGMPDGEPDFLYFARQISQSTRHLAGGFNFNGDAYDDVVVGGLDWDNSARGASNAGGVAFVAGRPADPGGKTTIICDESLYHLGHSSSDYFGRAMAAMGDLNGDGCDEIAIGAPRENAGISDQGVIHIVFGFGGAGCPANAEKVVIGSGGSSARAGYSLAGGVDVDGDTVPDLVVGGYNHRANSVTSGSAWVVSGAYIRGLPRIAMDADVDSSNLNPFQDPASTIRNIVSGEISGEQFGSGVSVIQGTMGSAAKIIVGSTQGKMSGTPRSGGARVFRFVPGVGFDLKPVAIFSGESNNPWNELGRMMDAQMVGARPMVVVGGIYGNGIGLDLGSVYTLDLSGL
jgi:hypothetical protein